MINDFSPPLQPYYWSVLTDYKLPTVESKHYLQDILISIFACKEIINKWFTLLSLSIIMGIILFV